MKEKLSFAQLISVSCMLFSIFFGAGNMIFPPMMGQLAGEQFFAAMLGFIVTDVGIAVLGVVAVVKLGSSMGDLASRVGKRFAVVLTITVYLLLGPFFAMPRTGSVSFELGVVPFLPGGKSVAASLIYTLIFFGLTFFLSLNPRKIVDIVGKVLTPFLLISIGAIFVTALFHPVGTISAATGEYAQIPFFKGLVEGYLALDGFAGLVFAITVISSLKSLGIHSQKALLSNAIRVGLVAAALLIVVYGALTYVGAQASSLATFSNGGALLSAVTTTLFGKGGSFIVGVAVMLACLTTSIGLATSFSGYFAGLLPRCSYRAILLAVCAFSFAVSNVGLATLISVVLPLLIMLYPVVTVMMVVSFFDRRLGSRPAVYIGGIALAFSVSFFDGLRNAGISLGFLSELALKIPFAALGVGWILPAVLGCLLGWGYTKLHATRPNA